MGTTREPSIEHRVQAWAATLSYTSGETEAEGQKLVLD